MHACMKKGGCVLGIATDQGMVWTARANVLYVGFGLAHRRLVNLSISNLILKPVSMRASNVHVSIPAR